MVEVTPPQPPKLLRMAQKVLAYVAALPPIELLYQNINLRDLATQAPNAEAYLLPCRASDLSFNVPTYFLDERPERRNRTMIACERSRQIRHHFYGDEAPRINMCPRQLAQAGDSLTLLKCCLLEDRIEIDGKLAIVPWGATLAQVEEALRRLAAVRRQ